MLFINQAEDRFQVFSKLITSLIQVYSKFTTSFCNMHNHFNLLTYSDLYGILKKVACLWQLSISNSWEEKIEYAALFRNSMLYKCRSKQM